MKIERLITVAEVSCDDNGVSLTVNAPLTWDEWDKLSKAIEDQRPGEYFTVESGWLIAGDIVNGQRYPKGGGAIRGVGHKRKKVPGYKPVYEGLVQAGDLIWTNAGCLWEPASQSDVGTRSVANSCYGVMRPI
jgi:hypothetical protein